MYISDLTSQRKYFVVESASLHIQLPVIDYKQDSNTIMHIYMVLLLLSFGLKLLMVVLSSFYDLGNYLGDHEFKIQDKLNKQFSTSQFCSTNVIIGSGRDNH